MKNFTSTTILGHATRDPDKRFTKTGKSLCTFSVAVNHYTPEDQDPRVSYYDIETWEKLADLCADIVRKGMRILVSGDMRQDRWQAEDGSTRSRWKLVGNEVVFLESPLRTEPQGQQEPEVVPIPY